MTTDLCRIVVYCESDFHRHAPFYPKPKSGAEYAFKLDLIVLLIPEYRIDINGRKIKVVENDKVKIEKEGKRLEIDICDLVADLVDHESMHMILYHLEGCSVSRKLDSLDILDDFRLLERKLHNSLWHRLLVKLHVFASVSFYGKMNLKFRNLITESKRYNI